MDLRPSPGISFPLEWGDSPRRQVSDASTLLMERWGIAPSHICLTRDALTALMATDEWAAEIRYTITGNDIGDPEQIYGMRLIIDERNAIDSARIW